ncbi:PD-(D/E)XK motif protein [Microbacterium dauci]|uniref:PD-(D/E)XK motif protein n=1 Tax=Microbacterium dauci TaxID=3048008 RepID=A0ABT6ZB58_9MICO|nr:PD-(D/E)XK motif protein [Microbacterium sp. LX3-4]MDJ1113393.1 PD-(D/E)XK motif protein [Microbacterium sp. LX3-4]
MTTPSDDSTHLDPRSVEEYFRLGAKTAFPLHASPSVIMEIDPGREEVELRTPAVGSEPEVTALQRLSFSRIRRDGDEWFRLVVDARDMHYEAYVLLESIVDQLKSGASFRHAVSEAVASLKDLLAGRTRLTEEKVLGLVGELLVLAHSIEALGEEAAITAWLGPLSEEHDFAFHAFDAEVKTTKSEGRVHVIGSETQLEPEPGRPLHLVSIQLTRAGLAEQGFTLPSLIDNTRARLDQTRRTFDAALEGLGWRNRDRDLYPTRYQLRSMPRAYLVDDQFPAITSGRLDQVVPQRAHVASVTYRVNVTDLAHSAIAAPLHDFCEDPE